MTRADPRHWHLHWVYGQPACDCTCWQGRACLAAWHLSQPWRLVRRSLQRLSGGVERPNHVPRQWVWRCRHQSDLESQLETLVNDWVRVALDLWQGVHELGPDVGLQEVQCLHRQTSQVTVESALPLLLHKVRREVVCASPEARPRKRLLEGLPGLEQSLASPLRQLNSDGPLMGKALCPSCSFHQPTQGYFWPPRSGTWINRHRKA